MSICFCHVPCLYRSISPARGSSNSLHCGPLTHISDYTNRSRVSDLLHSCFQDACMVCQGCCKFSIFRSMAMDALLSTFLSSALSVYGECSRRHSKLLTVSQALHSRYPLFPSTSLAFQHTVARATSCVICVFSCAGWRLRKRCGLPSWRR